MRASGIDGYLRVDRSSTAAIDVESAVCALQPSPSSYWIVSPAAAQHLRGEAFVGGIDLVRRWLARRRQIRALADLDDRLLTDVGITREAAEREIARTFSRTNARRHMK